METWEKVTARSQVSVYWTNDPMETIAAIDLKHDQDGRNTHIWKKNTLSNFCKPMLRCLSSLLSLSLFTLFNHLLL